MVLFYCLGIALVERVRVNFWIISGSGVLILTAACLSFRHGRLTTILVFVLSLLLGALSLKSSFILPKYHIANCLPYGDKSLYSLSGSVESIPVTRNGRSLFVFRVRQVQLEDLKWPSCGKILVNTDFAQKLDYAQRLTLIGSPCRIHAFSASSRSYRRYLYRQGIYRLMRIKSSLRVILEERKDGNRLVIFPLWLRERMGQMIRRYLPELPAAVVLAMVLGQKDSVPWLVNDLMVKSGTVHILVVSGFNVGIVAFVANLLFKTVRIRRKMRIIFTIICLLVYCLVTGASNPVVRATVMGIIFLAGYLIKREADIYNCLACAAMFILLFSPGQLFDIGFQLSFSSVLAIVYFYPKIKSFLRLDNCRSAILKFISEGFLVSFSAWAGTIAIIACNFRMVSPLTVLANIFIVPLATLITLCGFSLLLCGSFCPLLGSAFGSTASALVSLLLNTNVLMAKIPGAYFYF